MITEDKGAAAGLMEEWRRISIPAWRRILKESIQEGNKRREKYARWMLKEVLKDKDYKGGSNEE